MKKNQVIKRLLLLLTILVILFATVNLIWLFFVKFPYDRMAGKLDRIEEQIGDETYVRYEKTVDGYEYSVRVPEYLNFEGRMLVNEISDSAQQEICVSLTVYTEVFHSNEYMIDIFGAESESSGSSVEFMIDEDGRYLPYENMESMELHQKLAEEYQDRIKKILECAKEMFESK